MIPRSAAVLLFTGLAAAQYTPPPMVVRPLPVRGIMSGLSAGLIFENKPAVLVHKATELPAKLSTFESQHVPGVAEYHKLEGADGVVAFLNQRYGVELPPLEVDAISSGNDLLPLAHVPPPSSGGGQPPSPGGYFMVSYGPQVWATLSLVLQDEQGGPTDISCCYFDNRSFPDLLRNQVVHEILAAEFEPNDFDHEGSNIAAMDFALGQILANRGVVDPGILNCVDRLYFSITSDCAAAIRPLATSTSPELASLDGSTIFEVIYGSSGGVYAINLIQPLAPVTNEPMELDIDALGVANVTAVPPNPTGTNPIFPGRMMLVSYTQPVGGEELFAIAHTQQATQSILPLRSPTLQKLAGPGGLDSRRVKGLCGRDPEGHFGARSFGVPTVDLSSGTDDAVTLSSTHVLSVEVRTAVLDTGSRPKSDLVNLSGVVTGAPQNGSICILWVLHEGQYRWFPLGVWPANQTYLPFSIDLDTPWSTPIPGSTVSKNEYELIVTMLPGPTSTTPLALSNRALVRRMN